MEDDALLTLTQTVDALIAIGYPATKHGLRNAVLRGTGPQIVQDGANRLRQIKWLDARAWAQNRTWYDPRTMTAISIDGEETETLRRQCVLDQIILSLKAMHPRLFDRINKIHGPERREILNCIAAHAIEYAENELLEFVETLD